jgi:hypothetical protein
VCGWLVMRQLTTVLGTSRLLRRYGVDGTVRLCSGRAFLVYMFPIGAAAVGFAVSGVGSVAVALYGVLLLVGMFVVARSVSAARAGRRWRREGSCLVG